jgi:hypothetical protein
VVAGTVVVVGDAVVVGAGDAVVVGAGAVLVVTGDGTDDVDAGGPEVGGNAGTVVDCPRSLGDAVVDVVSASIDR